MNSKEKTLQHIDRNGRGLEIGPSFSPIAPKREGFQVDIMDVASRDGLRAKYAGHNVNLENIEEVDFVWSGQKYADLTGHTHYYDWIIASNLLEHVPDLIGFLHDCAAILKEDGVLSLVVPDKRYCFDHFRPLSSLAAIIDRHYANTNAPSPGTAAEHHLNAVKKGGRIAWEEGAAGPYSFAHTVDDARHVMHQAATGTWHDVHHWCFTPDWLRLVIQDLYDLELSPFRELSFHPTVETNFHMTISPGGPGCPLSRLELLHRCEREDEPEPVSFVRTLLKKFSK